MGIIDTIIRSQDDLTKRDRKSYWGCDLSVKTVSVDEIADKVNLLPAEKRAFKHELSKDKEPISQVIILDNKNRDLGRLNTNQLKEMLDDMGFNVDVILSEKRFSDFSAVMNIRGYIIPGWKYLFYLVAKVSPQIEKLMLTKLSPGRERLHIRLFENNDGSWIIAAHTDYNWMNFNPLKVFRAHLADTGAGDYEMGTVIMERLLKAFNESMKERAGFHFRDIEKVVSSVYRKKG